MLIGLLAGPGSAAAEEVFTSQSAAANAISSTWIPAPDNPAAVCIVDTGVDPNPDTTNVIARLSVDGGDPGDVDTVGHHGTLMAMIASAPYNGWGMVGAAPSVKVVSVRAKRPGESGFYFSDVLKGVQMCRKYRDTFNIKVISLSLGGQATFDVGTTTLLENTLDIARASSMNVVAAAGNHPGQPDWPASYGPVFAIAASDASGSLCAFSASGSGVDLSVPGCPQDVALPDGRAAWASGTSESTAFGAAALAQLRGLRPELGVDGAEELFVAAADTRGAAIAADVDAAFRSAGVDLGPAASLTPSSAQRGPLVAPSTSSGITVDADRPLHDSGTPGAASAIDRNPHEPTRLQPRLPTPSVRARRLRDGVLQLTFFHRPVRVLTRMRAYTRRRDAAFPVAGPWRLVTGDRLRTRVSGAVSQMSIMYVDPTAKRKASAVLVIRP